MIKTMMGELKIADRLLKQCATLMFNDKIADHIPGGLKEEVVAWLRATHACDFPTKSKVLVITTNDTAAPAEVVEYDSVADFDAILAREQERERQAFDNWPDDQAAPCYTTIKNHHAVYEAVLIKEVDETNCIID